MDGNMQSKGVFILMMLVSTLCGWAQGTLEEVRQLLQRAPVQEKVYLHMDNQCYFKGDTIWYKAYVVRADSLTYTDMSRILYVELVSPDGLLVERQQIIISSQGYSDGNFVLQDSIYSGYYEVRAYTRWMLNFKVSEHDHKAADRAYFYNAQMARDFFRQFGTIYSRVFPVYERPEQPGDYTKKYILSRPKRRLDKALKENLLVNFYPEGGHLVANTHCRVAFEATNEEGAQVDIAGKIGNTPIRTEHHGRGAFVIDVPAEGELTADFSYGDKDYHIRLPKIEKSGCALRLEHGDGRLVVNATLRGMKASGSYATAILCRGTLRHFAPLTLDDKGQATMEIDTRKLPTGVCDLLIVDDAGQLLADRLFFVNNHDYGMQTISVEGNKADYGPYEEVKLEFQAPADAAHISIAVRDASNDSPTYDTGNILTDMLLGSELKGFIAYPHYYFERDDDTRRRALDLLMMVQGWRRYDYQELTDKTPLRYQPETAMTIVGSVYPTVDSEDYEPSDIKFWAQGIFGYRTRKMEDDSTQLNSMGAAEIAQNIRDNYERGKRYIMMRDEEQRIYKMGTALYIEGASGLDIGNASNSSHGSLKHEVTVESELVIENDVATIALETTNGGRFSFSLPPYYGQAILFMSAHDTDLSERKAKRLRTKGVLDETAWPEYYVKRDLFYPVFAKKYSWYQCHQPHQNMAGGTLGGAYLDNEAPLSSFDRELSEVFVDKKLKRGRRAIDFSKPTCVYDAQMLYNLVTDRGLLFGRYEADKYPTKLAMAIFGNYNSNQQTQVMAQLNDQEGLPYVYYRNYKPLTSINQNRSDTWIDKNIKLKRQDKIRLYTDFDLRNEDKYVEQNMGSADVTLDVVLLANEAKQYTFRDRRLVLDGMYKPDEFYHPNYSGRELPDLPKDYRRTLYWNANAQLDSEGRFTARFYNNGKDTHIRVSAAGLTADGMPIACDK